MPTGMETAPHLRGNLCRCWDKSVGTWTDVDSTALSLIHQVFTKARSVKTQRQINLVYPSAPGEHVFLEMDCSYDSEETL